MTKIINAPDAVIDDYIDGLTALHPGLARVQGWPIVVRNQASRKGNNRVAIISGGGSGHEPAHAGFVGVGMLDAAVLGPIFTSPSVDAVYAGIRAVATDAGVLLVVKNYTGDRLNFGLAAEMARADGIAVGIVVVADDCALGDLSRAGRRGLTGTILVHKLAGAAAERGWSLDRILETANEFLTGVGTMGVAIGSCYVPGATQPNFVLGENEVEWGLGIHGESGRVRGKAVDSRETAGRLVAAVVEDRGMLAGDTVVVIANGLGGTPDLELQIFGGDALSSLQEKGLVVERFWAGAFLTALEMPGVSLTVAKTTSLQLELLSDECNVVAFPRFAPTVGREPDLVLPELTVESTGDAGNPLTIALTAGHTAAVATICRTLVDAEVELTDLDRVVGDGDLGTNLARGARAVLAQADQLSNCAGLAKCLRAVSDIVRREVGGTSGPLYSLFLMGLADGVSQAGATKELNPTVWAEALALGLEKIQSIGGAQPGDSTMVDALHPAVGVFALEIVAGSDVTIALKMAAAAAIAGAESTREIRPELGRSSYVGDRAVGHPDPGAVAVAIQIEALYSALYSSSEFGSAV